MKQIITLIALLAGSVNAWSTTRTLNATTTFHAQLTGVALSSGDTIQLPTTGNIDMGSSMSIGTTNLVIIVGHTFTMNSNRSLSLHATAKIILPSSLTSLVVNNNVNAKVLIGTTTVAAYNTTTIGAGVFTSTGFASGATALPVTITAFDASYTSGQVQLKFDVDQEKDVAFYELERSTDGSEFARLGAFVDPMNAAGARTYRLQDIQPASGTNYYRIAIHEKDGSNSYSGVVSVRTSATTGKLASIYPNPATTTINISNGIASAPYAIVDMAGRTVQTGILAGSTSEKLDISMLQAGNYTLLMSGTENQQGLRFCKIAD